MNVYTMWFPAALLAPILAPLLALTFGTAEAVAEVPRPRTPAVATAIPDLCETLDRFGDPSRCVAVGPDMAPWWDGEVCCDAQTCTEPSSTGCARGMSLYWCDNAVLHRDGSLDCVYEVPAYCDLFPCSAAATTITAPPLENAICCHETGCYDHQGGPCGGDEVWCGKGVTNDDGTITCFDES